MPELPEVQTVVNDLRDLNFAGRAITQIMVYWRRSVDEVTDRILRQRLSGKTIAGISRRGKYIVFHLKDETVFIIHLRMSGRIHYARSGQPRDKHEHVILRLDNGFDIRLYDPRKFGRLYSAQDAKRKIDTLGPEPLADNFTSRKFGKLLSGRSRRIKPLLLDQTAIAGLGNIYTDEALWQARIHPLRLASRLDARQKQLLYRSIRSVLRRGIRNFGTTLGNGKGNFISANKRRGSNLLKLMVYGRDRERCLRCGRSIVRIVVAQRSTHICPHCQKLGSASNYFLYK